MQLFACDHCHAPVFFDNYECTSCGYALAFLPDLFTMSALEPLPLEPLSGAACAAPPEQAGRPESAAAAPQQAPENSAGSSPTQAGQEPGESPPPAPVQRYTALAANGAIYRMCQNHVQHAACGWAVRDEDPEPLCWACRLNNVIPDLGQKEQKEAWLRLEAAKRRLLYSLYLLRLPVESRAERPDNGLAFSFMAGDKDEPVFTGHNDGLITINVAEADDPFREKMRAQLGEAYRTVLGHFRHEIGHYYWDRLVKDSPWLDPYRALFGDETLDYQEALDRHYKEGAPKDWGERFVSQYASMHPWEDWAETWAHYMHMFDTLETAKAYGLRVKVSKRDAPATVVDTEEVRVDDFDQMAEDWVPLTVALNSLNRSMGLRDLYPFVLTDTVLEKLRFVHRVIRACSAQDGLQVEAREQNKAPRDVGTVQGEEAQPPVTRPKGKRRKGLRATLFASRRTG